MKRSVGAFDSCASSTSFTTRAIVLSAAAAVTRTLSRPSPLTVPANTFSSWPFRTGLLSPVTGASSMELSPETITPSAGMRSPGRTWIVAPTAKRFGLHLADLAAIVLEPSGLRHQLGQILDAGACPAGGDAFEQLADQEEKDDRRRLFRSADEDGADCGDRSSASRSRTACRPSRR